jgi:hypothetical protein
MRRSLRRNAVAFLTPHLQSRTLISQQCSKVVLGVFMRQVVLVVSLLLLSACGPVLQKVNRTGFGTGPYLPSRTGAPLEDGEIRLAGELNSMLPLGPTTFEGCDSGDPGLWIPKYQVGGSFFGALSRWVELGGFARFTRLDWARRCNTCVGPFNDHDDSDLVWAGGASARFNFDVEEQGFISLAIELGLANFHQEIDGRQKPATVPHAGLFLQGGTRLDEHFSLFALVGMESLRSNRRKESWVDDPNHFDDDPPDHFAYLVVPVGAGAEFRFQELYLNAVISYPLSTADGIQFGPAVFAQAGVTL